MRAIFYLLLLIGILTLNYGTANLWKPWVTESEQNENYVVGWIAWVGGLLLIVVALVVNP